MHERHFGLVGPDGSLKPQAATIETFKATNQKVVEAKRQDTPRHHPG